LRQIQSTWYNFANKMKKGVLLVIQVKLAHVLFFLIFLLTSIHANCCKTIGCILSEDYNNIKWAMIQDIHQTQIIEVFLWGCCFNFIMWSGTVTVGNLTLTFTMWALSLSLVLCHDVLHVWFLLFIFAKERAITREQPWYFVSRSQVILAKSMLYSFLTKTSHHFKSDKNHPGNSMRIKHI
jgi:hypothetical protein